jgi:hypothetical protein
MFRRVSKRCFAGVKNLSTGSRCKDVRKGCKRCSAGVKYLSTGSRFKAIQQRIGTSLFLHQRSEFATLNKTEVKFL